uniref:Uncharacterized protein n=1 Tax=Arundo donax TaxID=35708 RepID=A0A0A9FKQ9_ARUDO
MLCHCTLSSCNVFKSGQRDVSSNAMYSWRSQKKNITAYNFRISISSFVDPGVPSMLEVEIRNYSVSPLLRLSLSAFEGRQL